MSGVLGGDILYYYQTDFDQDGNELFSKEITAKVIGFDGDGTPIVNITSGEEYMNDGDDRGRQFAKIGNTYLPARQKGMYFDSVSADAPRIVLYDGVDRPSKFKDPTTFISALGVLGWNDADFGWLTSDGTSTGTPLVGLYSDNVFLKGKFEITGGSAREEIDAKVAAADLGVMAYEDLVELAKLGTTIIEGGYLKTTLINAAAIIIGNAQVTGLGNLATMNTSDLGDLALEDLVEAAKLGTTVIQGGYLVTDLINVVNLFSTNITVTGLLQSNDFATGTSGWQIPASGVAEFQNVKVRTATGSVVDWTHVDNVSIVNADITNLDASKITTGLIGAERINVTDLFAQNITATGTISGLTLESSTFNTGAGYPYEVSIDSNGIVFLEIGSSLTASIYQSSNGLYFATNNASVEFYFGRDVNITGNLSVSGSYGLVAGDIPDLSASYAAASHSHTFASLTSKPTTLAGYGITDAAASSHGHTLANLTGDAGSPGKLLLNDAYGDIVISSYGPADFHAAVSGAYTGTIVIEDGNGTDIHNLLFDNGIFKGDTITH